MNEDELLIVTNLRDQIEELKRENNRLAEILGLQSTATLEGEEGSQGAPTQFDTPPILVDRTSPVEAKIELFRSLFVGRDDVYALRWEAEGRESTVGRPPFWVVSPTPNRRVRSTYR